MNNSTRLLIAQNMTPMLAYWNTRQVCMYINEESARWYGRTPGEIIEKLTLKELLGEVYNRYLPYIERALKGETQVFEREFNTGSSETMRGLVTYHPDIEYGVIKGFFVHIVKISLSSNTSRKDHNPISLTCKNDITENNTDPKMKEVSEYLREEIFNGFPGLDTIAKKYHVSVSKLKRDFKTSYKTTPLNLYRSLQMDYAEKHSKEQKISKKELASILNFSNPSNFSNYFKKFIDEVGEKRQQALIKQQSQELNRIFIEQSPFSIAMFDTDMNYLAVSQQWMVDYQIVGMEIIGKNNAEIFPAAADKFKSVFSDSLSGNINKCDEYCRVNKDGNVQWLKWDIRPWYSEGKEVGGLLIFTEDITEMKRNENASLRANYILSKTSEMAKIGTWERDLLTGKVTSNKVTLEIMELDELRKVSIEDNIKFFYKDESSREKVNTAINEALHQGKNYDIEVEIVTAKQNTKLVRIIGQVEFNHGIATTLFGLFIELKKNS